MTNSLLLNMAIDIVDLPYIPTYLPTYIHTSIHPHIHTSIHPYIQASRHACMMHLCYTHTYTYTHTHEPTYLPTYLRPCNRTHTYIYTYVYISNITCCTLTTMTLLKGTQTEYTVSMPHLLRQGTTGYMQQQYYTNCDMNSYGMGRTWSAQWERALWGCQFGSDHRYGCCLFAGIVLSLQCGPPSVISWFINRINYTINHS